jgi:hypothetical protein
VVHVAVACFPTSLVLHGFGQNFGDSGRLAPKVRPILEHRWCGHRERIALIFIMTACRLGGGPTRVAGYPSDSSITLDSSKHR